MQIKPSLTDVEILEEKQEEVAPSHLDGSVPGEINTIAVKQVLEIEDSDMSRYEGDIKTLIDWAKTTTGSDDYADLKWAIRDLQLKIGTPAFGDRIKNLSRFAYLDLEEKKIKKEKESFH